MLALEYSRGAVTVSSARFKTRNMAATHRGLQAIPVRSRMLDLDATILVISVKGSILEYVDRVYAAGVVMGDFQYTASLDLVLRPVSEQTFGVIAPLWVLTNSAWRKRMDFAGVDIKIHPWPRR